MMARDVVPMDEVHSIDLLLSRDKSGNRTSHQFTAEAEGHLRSPHLSAIIVRDRVLPRKSPQIPLMRRSRFLHIFASIATVCAVHLPGSPSANAEVTPSFPQQTILSENQPYASSIIVADFDGDGWTDVAAASFRDNQISWYRNNGDGTFSTAIVISTAAIEPSSLAAADIDGDGRIDLVSASHLDNKIAWYRNVGGAPAALFGNRASNQIVISKSANFAYSVAVADIDGDGLFDVVSASLIDSKIAWYRNLGGGNFGWSAAKPDANQKVISTASIAPTCVAAGDLDGDGITDLAVTSVNDASLVWLKGSIDGTGAVTFTRHVISTDQASAYNVTMADMNHDHRLDLICAAAAGNKIAYFKNMTGVAGAAGPFFAPEQIVSGEAGGVESVIAADINRDGNPDIVAALLFDDKVVWHAGSAPDENGDVIFGPAILVSSDVAGPASVIVADFDGDSVMDIASASQNDSKIAAYINGAAFDGDVTLAPTLVAPAGGALATNPMTISYTLPEDALAGSVAVSFTRGALVRQLVLAADLGTAGAHTFSFDPANPGASPAVAGGSATIADGTYTVTLSYQDAAGNPAASSRPAIGVTIDAVAPFLPGTLTSILVKKGGAVPGAGEVGSGVPADATLRIFAVPSINDAGHLAVTAAYSSAAGARQVILGPSSTGQTAVLVGAGDAVPDASGALLNEQRFFSVQDVLLNDADAIAFIGTVRGVGVAARNDRGIWTNAGDGRLRLVARKGDVAAGLTARFDAFTSVALGATLAPATNLVAGPAGQTDVAFTAHLAGAGVTVANDEGLWIHRSSSSADGSVKLALRKGQKLALRGGVAKQVRSFIALGAIDGAQGQGRGAVPSGVAVRVLFGDGTQAVVRIDAAGVIDDVAVTGDAIADASANLLRFGVPAQNTRGDTLAGVLLSGLVKNTALLFATLDGGSTLAARAGDDADGIDGAAFAGFRAGVVNDDRRTAFIAAAAGPNVNAANNDGIWSEGPAEARVLIAREGAQPAGIADGARWEIFHSLALPDGAHGPVFLASMSVPAAGRPNPAHITAANNTGVWAVDSSGALQLILREGDVLPGTGSPIRVLTLLGNVAGSPAQTRSYNGSGDIICRATLADGSEVIAKTHVP